VTRPSQEPRGCNLAADLFAAQHAAGRGRLAAVVDEEGAWSYDDLAGRAAAAAGALREAGVRRRERVLIALPGGRDWAAAFLGALWAGAVAVPVDPAIPVATAEAVVEDVTPVAVVSEDDSPWCGRRPLSPAALAAGGEVAPAPRSRDDLAFLVMSSGSTGRPKGVQHVHGAALAQVRGCLRGALGAGPADRCHAAAAPWTALGLFIGLLRPLGAGATAVLTRRRPGPRATLNVLADQEVTVAAAVPALWDQIAAFMERNPEAGRRPWSLRAAVASGDVLAPAVAQRAGAAIGVDLLDGLGAAECGDIVLLGRAGAAGRPVPGVEVRVVSDSGRAGRRGEPGRLAVRAPTCATGYWRRPEPSRDLCAGDWIHLGDRAVREAGGLRWVGRADDLLKVDGTWVSPAAVEACLATHPAVAEAAVVGRAAPSGARRPVAFVVPAGGPGLDAPTASALVRHVARALGRASCPATVSAVAALPRLPSGKLDRRRLLAPAAPGAAAAEHAGAAAAAVG